MGRWADDEKRKMEALQDNLRADAEPLEKYTHIGEVGGRRLDGYKKAGGRADYTMDVQLPGMLYMRFLDCPFPHAKILRMDTSRAEKLPGVRYILRYDNPELPAHARPLGQARHVLRLRRHCGSAVLFRLETDA